MTNVVTDEQLWAELEEIGEDKVRTRLATNVYGHAGNKRVLVEEWLRRKDQARKDSSNREQIAIARAAAAAAWDATGAARSAAKTAKIALTIAVISIIVSIISLFLKS